MIDQSRVFEEGEGDQWFARNVGVLSSHESDDPITDMLARASAQGAIGSLCEIGCANGWRLAAARRLLPQLRRTAGFDVSREAVQDGRRRWPELELEVGPADRPPVTGPFDAVLVSFVLHWVDRSRLAASIAAIDGLVALDGLLILADFLPDSPCIRRYHHRSDCEVYTYKQDYSACFTALGFYREEEAAVFDHATHRRSGAIDEQNRAFVKVLRKSTDEYRRL